MVKKSDAVAVPDLTQVHYPRLEPTPKSARRATCASPDCREKITNSHRIALRQGSVHITCSLVPPSQIHGYTTMGFDQTLLDELWQGRDPNKELVGFNSVTLPFIQVKRSNKIRPVTCQACHRKVILPQVRFREKHYCLVCICRLCPPEAVEKLPGWGDLSGKQRRSPTCEYKEVPKKTLKRPQRAVARKKNDDLREGSLRLAKSLQHTTGKSGGAKRKPDDECPSDTLRPPKKAKHKVPTRRV